MADKEQVKPLAPAELPCRFHIGTEANDNNNNIVVVDNSHRKRHCIKIIGCLSAILVITAVTLIILAFTVFHVKGPIVTVNSITAIGGELIPTKNITLIANISVKNPNVASFRYKNTSTTVFYGGAAVGEGRSPGGLARARRTVRANMTVDVALAKIMASQRLTEDLASGSLTMETYTRIEGRIKMIVNKRVVVKLNCTMVYNISGQKIEKQDCKHKVNI